MIHRVVVFLQVLRNMPHLNLYYVTVPGYTKKIPVIISNICEKATTLSTTLHNSLFYFYFF